MLFKPFKGYLQLGNDTARANVSFSNVCQTFPQVDDLEARGVYIPRYISFNEKHEFEEKLTSVTCMHANVLKLRAAGVPDYAREKNNLETDLFSLGLVNMHALQRAHIRVHKERDDTLQARTCGVLLAGALCARRGNQRPCARLPGPAQKQADELAYHACFPGFPARPSWFTGSGRSVNRW